jgi:hypothetical protein
MARIGGSRRLERARFGYSGLQAGREGLPVSASPPSSAPGRAVN